MTERIGRAVLELSTDGTGFVRGLDQAEGRLAAFGNNIKSIGDNAKKVGQALLPVSAAIAGVGGVALKSAVDFEASFAGIRKTVADATDPLGNLTEVGRRLQQGMLALSEQIPVNVNELNAIGEAAGQLGIKSENILGFTRVMADLGVTTNLSSDQAATALARLANITQMPQDQFDRLGSTIVALGNNLATTEAEITEFGLRIAGAGAQVGLTEAQILGIGAALSSVGINAEAGGTAISKVMIDMASSVAEGGERMAMFADVAGVTASQFKQQFETDAAGALTAFVTGLGNMESRGQSTLGVLNEMGFTEARLRDALLRSAGAGDLLANSLKIGTEAWAENNALTKEAEQRYRTTAAQLQLFWNQAKRVAIELGDALLPLLRSGLEVVKEWIPAVQAVVRWFSELSPGIQTAIVAVGGIVAALGPALVAFGMVASAIGAALPVLSTVGAAFVTFATGPIGWVVAAIAGLTAAWAIWGDDIQRIVGETYAAVKNWLVDQWDGSIFQSVARMLEAMGRLFGALATVAIEKATALYLGVKTWVLDKLQPVFDAIRPILDGAARLFTSAKDAIVGTTRALYEGVKGWLLDRFTAIVDGIKAKIDAVTGFFNNMYDKVVGNSFVPDMIDRISEEFGRLPAVMVEPARHATAQVNAAFEDSGRSIAHSLDQAIGNIGKRLSGFTDSILPKFGENTQGFMGGLMGSLNDLMSGGMNSLINMGLSLAIEGVKKIGSAIAGLFKSEESKHVNQPRDQFFDHHGGYDGLARKLGEKVDGSTAERLIGALYAADTASKWSSAQDAIIALIGGQKFARGGFVTGPTLGMVGESGPEVIYPLERFERMLGLDGGGQPLLVRLEVDGVTLAERMVRHMPRALSHAGLA